MKKNLYKLAIAAMAALPAQSFAQFAPSADKDVFDFSWFQQTGKNTDKLLLDLFYNALKDGRKYPTQQEFEAAGLPMVELQFMRSHVRCADILENTDRVVPGTYENRKLFMATPLGNGKGHVVGHPSANFHSDVYSLWNYTETFAHWNHGLFSTPGAPCDAAHRNGTVSMSGLKFFDAAGGQGDYDAQNSWKSLITEREQDGSFKYVKPLINLLMYLGSDGIVYNFEAGRPYAEKDVIEVNKALYKEAEASGFKEFRIMMYTTIASLTPSNANQLFGNSEGRTAHTMLNYSANDFSTSIASSVKNAENAMGTSEGLYTGAWIVTMDRRWTSLDQGDAHRCNIYLWGEHAQSRYWSYNTGAGTYEAQTNYQYMLERLMSGGNRNPINRPAVKNTGNSYSWNGSTPPLSTFAGMATWIPERATVKGSNPFGTHFNLGNGDGYYYKGRKTAGPWYNLSAQDVVPTWRWLVTDARGGAAANIFPEFSHKDAYIGGSCLKLSASAAGGQAGDLANIELFKTDLKMGSNPVVKIAFKDGKDGSAASKLRVIVRKHGETSFRAYEVGAGNGASWQEKTVKLDGVERGDVIERIGLQVEGADADWSIYVGKLEINHDETAMPSEVKNLRIDVKQETSTSMTVKMDWDVDAMGYSRGAQGLVYNDEANIDHFEILYKNGKDGRVSEIGRTSQWATVVYNMALSEDDTEPYFGVRAASVDRKSYSDVVWQGVSRSSNVPENTEFGNYGFSQIDESSEGVDVARAGRYFVEAKTDGAVENLNYTAAGPVADGTNYCDARKHKLVVKQGQRVKLYWKAAAPTEGIAKGDGLKWCVGAAWIDWDGSGDFNHPLPVNGNYLIGADKNNPSVKESIEFDPQGECIFRCGTLLAGTDAFETTGVTYEFDVPQDAHVGQSLLRITFSDAWFAGQLTPVGYTAKGFTIDFNVEIQGDEQGQRTYVDPHDQGVAAIPEGLGGEETGVEAAPSAVSYCEATPGGILFHNTDRAWVYTVDGRLAQFVKAANGSEAKLPAGIYAVRMQSGNVTRSQKVAVK